MSFSRPLRALDHDFSAAVSIGTGVVVALFWSAVGPSSYQRAINEAWPNHFFRQVSIDSVHSLVASALMTLFFFAIGLELSRELRTGALTKATFVVPPVLGAIGGMAGTALLSYLFGELTNSGALRRGWGVPMATDIAFTLGVLALVGRRLPSPIRIFLLTLAVADDAFSVVVLAFTGATHARLAGIVALPLMIVVGIVISRTTRRVGWGLALLAGLWVCFVWANVEPPLAGVIAGLLISFDNEWAPRLEHSMGRCSTGFVLPLFALVSCGVDWHEFSRHSKTLTIVTSLVAIRILGKVVGISGGVGAARLIRFRLDPSITWPLLASVSVLCAIGFTVPLLFAGTLFGTRSATYGAFTVGLLAASLIATVFGVLLLRMQTRVP
jgi:NhaA family Na+:H+ antiporter